MRIEACDEFRGQLYGLYEVAPRDANEARIVRIVGEGGRVRFKLIEQLAECGIDRTLMSQFTQDRALAAACGGSAFRHVGRLIPGEHSTRRAEIANLKQVVF